MKKELCIGLACMVMISMGCMKKEEAIGLAVVKLRPTLGHVTRGIVTFEEEAAGVLVKAEIKGLKPKSQHGWHIHQYGDIRDPKGKSAGGHYNPEGHPHGLPPNEKRHAGSFGNLEADASGNATIEFYDTSITVSGKKNPIIGRSLVIHAKKDTGEQPAGNAGARVAVGVIGIANPSVN